MIFDNIGTIYHKLVKHKLTAVDFYHSKYLFTIMISRSLISYQLELDEIIKPHNLHHLAPTDVLIFKLPIIYFLSIPVDIYIFYEVSLTLIGIMHHSNIRVPSWLDSFLCTIVTMPSMHNIHHNATPKDTNSNYGFIFSFWDKLFKTRSNSKQHGDWKFGLKYAPEKSLLRLIYYPFSNKHLRGL